MSASFLIALLASASVLQGCTAVAAVATLDLDRQRRDEARTTGLETASRPPAPGDTLRLTLDDGRRAGGPFEALTADSLFLAGGQAFALQSVSRVERPWRRVRATRTFLITGALDLALLAFVGYALSNVQLDGLDLNW